MCQGNGEVTAAHPFVLSGSCFSGENRKEICLHFHKSLLYLVSMRFTG